MRTVSTGTIYDYEEDMLGSSRTMVQAGQTSVCFDADFLPFGYEKDVTTTCTQNYKFEGRVADPSAAALTQNPKTGTEEIRGDLYMPPNSAHRGRTWRA